MNSGRPPLSARDKDIKQRYEGGEQTLAEIGAIWNLSKHTVKHIVAAMGLDYQARRAKQKAMRRQKEWDKRETQCQQRYGCSWDTLCELQEIGRQMQDAGCSQSRTPLGAFHQQRQNARERGIEWQLTLGEWWHIWDDSGHWEYRGKGQDRYVMSRFGDTGPYCAGNVFIQKAVENNSQRPQKQNGLPMGVHLTANGRYTAMRMTDGKMRYLGVFDTIDEARHAYQMNRRTLTRKQSGLPRGVRQTGETFQARTRVNGRWRHLGTFATALEASAAYQAAISA